MVLKFGYQYRYTGIKIPLHTSLVTSTHFTQLAFTCSKLTIETKQIVKNGIVLVSLLLTLNIFTTCFSVVIVNFEHVITGWVMIYWGWGG